jgi:glutaredoxin
MFTSAPTRVAGMAALAALLLASPAVSAETTYRWTDPNTGRTVISDLPPPPGVRQVTKYTTTIGGGERQPSYAVRQASEKFPVVLYTSAGCGDPCKQARALLNARGVPFAEKVLESEEDLTELGRQLGGEAQLPIISVGRQSARGFEPTKWNDLLDAATYPATAPYRARTPEKRPE